MGTQEKGFSFREQPKSIRNLRKGERKPELGAEAIRGLWQSLRALA